MKREGLSQRVRKSMGSVIGCLMVLVLIAVGSMGTLAQCRGSTEEVAAQDLPEVREIDSTNVGEMQVRESITKAWRAAGGMDEKLDILIVQSKELNAASFGNGRFLFWASTAELPSPQIDAIAAHEVAHDMLLHSRRSQDAHEFLGFFAEVLGILAGADPAGDSTIREWLAAATLPRYSREQEFEADQKAIDLLGRMGHANPQEQLASTLEMLIARHGDSGGQFFDLHPATSERVARARSQ